MSEPVYTTHGYLDASLVYRIDSVVSEDEKTRVIRSDKYIAKTGEWVGNDINVIVKGTMIEMGAETGQFGGKQNG